MGFLSQELHGGVNYDHRYKRNKPTTYRGRGETRVCHDPSYEGR